MAMADNAKIAATSLLSMPAFLRRRGVDFVELCARVGIDPARADSGDGFISFAAFMALLRLGAQETGDPAFGVHYAEDAQPVPVGLFYHLTASVKTLGEAIAARIDYADAVVTGYRMAFAVEGDKASLIWLFPDDLGDKTQYAEYAVVFVVERIRKLVDRGWAPLEVWFDHAPTKSRDECGRICQCPVRFDMPSTRIVFDAATLAWELPNANKQLADLLKAAVEATAPREKTDSDFVEKAYSAAAKLLRSESLNIDALGKELGLSRRTLQRRLDENATSFRALMTNVQKRIGHYLLLQTDLPITEIALSLGFSDSSSFSRAAKNWYGQTPSELRAEKRNRLETAASSNI